VIVLVALTVGLVWWVSAWALGIKAFDAFLLTAFLVVAAAAIRMVSPFLKQLMGTEAAELEERGAEGFGTSSLG
jgi:hypothetical protein